MSIIMKLRTGLDGVKMPLKIKVINVSRQEVEFEPAGLPTGIYYFYDNFTKDLCTHLRGDRKIDFEPLDLNFYRKLKCKL